MNLDILRQNICSLLQALGQWGDAKKRADERRLRGLWERKSEGHLSLFLSMSLEQFRISEVFISGEELSGRTDMSVHSGLRPAQKRDF